MHVRSPHGVLQKLLEQWNLTGGEGEEGVAVLEEDLDHGLCVCLGSKRMRLPKPFQRRDLEEALHALAPDFITLGPFAFYPKQRLLEHRGEEIFLTEKESQILEVLAGAPGKILGKTALLEAIWGHTTELETHTLETHIYRLRKKLSGGASAPELILQEGDVFLKI